MLRSMLSYDRETVVGVDFDFVLQDQVAEAIWHWRQRRQREYVAVVNPHSVMLCRRDEGMREATQMAGMRLPDGVGIVLAAKMLGYGRRHRVTGPALMLAVCDQGRRYGFRHYFYGGSEGTAAKLARRMGELYPGMQVAGWECPPYRELSEEEDGEAVRRINEAGADVVWVGLGAPKQEKWMAVHAGRIHAAAMIGVGAAFDFHAGNVKWAPAWMRKCGLEWVYRLMREPRRMWRRNLDSPLFMMHVVGQMMGRKMGWGSARRLQREARTREALARLETMGTQEVLERVEAIEAGAEGVGMVEMEGTGRKVEVRVFIRDPAELRSASMQNAK